MKLSMRVLNKQNLTINCLKTNQQKNKPTQVKLNGINIT